MYGISGVKAVRNGRIVVPLPPTSIVLTVRNGVDAIGGTLSDFARLIWPHDHLQVVIVDAFSTDGTWELLQGWQAKMDFEVVLDQRAGGISAGRNRGFELATGEFVAVTDADMRVPPDWLERLMSGMAEGVGVVGGPNDGAGTDWLSRATNAIPMHGPSLGEVPVFGRSRYQRDFETTTDHFAAVTRNCLFRRAAFDAAGGFNESLMTAEDGELNLRILQAGYAIHYRREAGVVHQHRDSLAGFWRQQRNYARGQAQANRLHPEMRKPIHSMPATALLGLVVAAALASWWPPVAWLLAVGVVAAAVFTLGYAAKAARRHDDPRLLLGVPVLFVVWQLAWAIGYPEGLVRRQRLRGGAHAG